MNVIEMLRDKADGDSGTRGCSRRWHEEHWSWKRRSFGGVGEEGLRVRKQVGQKETLKRMGCVSLRETQQELQHLRHALVDTFLARRDHAVQDTGSMGKGRQWFGTAFKLGLETGLARHE